MQQGVEAAAGEAGAGGVVGGSGRVTGAGATPVTELPTCPVCLERLDEHISGIVTTVRVMAVLCGLFACHAW